MTLKECWCKLLSKLLLYFQYFWHSIRFMQFNPRRATKIFKVFLARYFWNIPEEKYFVPLRILNLFVKSFLNPFVDIAWTFLIFHLVHFFFYVTSFSLSKSVNFTKLIISLLLSKSACFNLAAKYKNLSASAIKTFNLSAVNLLNYGVLIYLLLWWWSAISSCI